MFNLGAMEIVTICLLALIVLGPQRLPDAAKQIGRFMGEMRRLSTGFQNELKTAFDDESEAAARARGAAVTPPASTVADPAPEPVPAAARPRRAQPLRAPATAVTPAKPSKPKPSKPSKPTR